MVVEDDNQEPFYDETDEDADDAALADDKAAADEEDAAENEAGLAPDADHAASSQAGLAPAGGAGSAADDAASSQVGLAHPPSSAVPSSGALVNPVVARNTHPFLEEASRQMREELKDQRNTICASLQACVSVGRD